MSASRGRFIVLEGPDGSGKTTQARRLVEHLRSRGGTLLHLRDPGDTPLGERIRALLLDEGHVTPEAETYLFLASRAQLVRERIQPALETGVTVICERFTLSTLVYQGHAAGLEGPALDAFRTLVAGSACGFVPDRTLLLDVPVDAGLRRKADAGALDRIEARGEEFQARVRAGYRDEARRDPGIVALPGGDADTVFAALRGAVEECHGD